MPPELSLLPLQLQIPFFIRSERKFVEVTLPEISTSERY